VNAVGIDQVAFALLAVRGWPEGDGKVVADALMKAQSLAQPECQRELFAELRITIGRLRRSARRRSFVKTIQGACSRW